MFGNISVWVWVFGVWVFYGYLENNCVSHADICQGMHMANSVYIPQTLLSPPMYWSKGTRVASSLYMGHYGNP